MGVWDILIALVIVTAIVGVLKYMGHTWGCGGKCDRQEALVPTAAHGCARLPSVAECPHPCHARSGRGK